MKTFVRTTYRSRLGKFIFQLSSLLFLLVACEKPEPPAPAPVDPVTAGAKGVYVLCEGLAQMNNTALCYYDFASGELASDIFLTANGRGLGDTGSDLEIYGGKMYAVVNLSETVEVMSLDARSLKRISLAGRQPRKIAFYQQNAYVSCYNGDIVRLDTATLEITGTAHAGSNPDGLCVANGKLYVANSGGLNYPNYGNSVSVFDLATFTSTTEITVGLNPMRIASDAYGDVYVVCNGNFSNVPASFVRISSQTDAVVQTFDFPATNFTICGDNAYIYYYDFNTQQSAIRVLDVFSETIVKESFITDGTQLQTSYAISVNPVNGDVYIADACQFTTNGDLFCFGADGKLKFRFETGMNPCLIQVM